MTPSSWPVRRWSSTLGILWAASSADGSKLAQYTLDVLPAWDAMAAAYGKLFIVNQDGSIDCWGK